MQKIAVALVQVALVVVVAHSLACSSQRQVVKRTHETIDPQVELRARLAALEAKGPLQFETDTDVLTGDSKAILREVAQQMFAHPRTRVIVTGHADERGDTAYNLALGERRGDAARAYLSRLGVPPGRVRTVSLGEEAPLSFGHDESAWAENRRDEFTFVLPSQLAHVDDSGEGLLVARVVFGE
jgi:outer membrane protein OmpA-like peptidoglycan-associated protein